MKTAVYARVSTAMQTHESQLNECRKWCSANGIEAKEYLDVMSGAKMKRPSFEELIEDCRAGRITTIVCYKLDRLGRSLVNISGFIQEMNKIGVGIVCVSQPIDTRKSSPVGNLIINVLLSCAEFERDVTRERVTAGIAAARLLKPKWGRQKGFGRQYPFEEWKKAREKGVGLREFSREKGFPAPSFYKALKKEGLL